MDNAFNRVCVMGLGYIGLPTAAVIAGRGLEVVGVDVHQRVVDTINKGEIHIAEPELDVVVRSVVTVGKLRATLKPETADVFIIAVPTPFKDEHQPDLAYVESATRAVAPVLKKGDLVVLESTSPVGTTEHMARWIAEMRPDLRTPDVAGDEADIAIAHCPERVLPGRILHELINNDRVIGGISMRCAQRAARFYRLFVRGECYLTTARTAELAKLAENTFRDINIAYANELSLICDRLGVNVWELIKLANRHPRVNILQPGAGVGGHCIAVDPWFIVAQFPDLARLTHAARLVNDGKPHFVMDKVRDAMQGRKGAVACLGLAFKPDVDDLRESPAMEIVAELAAKESWPLLVVEPNVKALPDRLATRPGVELVSFERALEEADVVVVLQKHREFIGIAGKLRSNQVVLDFCGAN